MHESFGARLRHHREKKGISLRTIANQTKISLAMLEGLERDDIRQWPSGIFRRAYVREYAQAIGLDPDALVREFVELYPAPIEVPEPPPPAPGRFRSLVDSALESLRPAFTRAGAAGSPAPMPVERVAPASDLALPIATAGSRASNPEPQTSDAGPEMSIPEPRVADVAPRVSDPGRRIPDIGPRASDVGHRRRGAGRRTSDGGPRTSDAGPLTPDLLAAARLCTELGRVEHTRQVPPLLREAVGLLGAKGLVVWVWDALSEELKPAVALGYPSKVMAQLGGLRRDADNATADAFRSAEARAIAGALVVPLLTPAACAGVLAIEMSNAGRPAPPVMAIATILAAMLAQLIGPDCRDV